jgi:thiamine pyrophosphate-dependent acetolactate synthase large subunit-like protein
MIDAQEMLKVFQQHRDDAIVVPGPAAWRHWVHLSTRPNRDVPLVPYPPMGGGASFGFGLALAQPNEKVVVFDSEGSLLIHIGVLATIADLAPPNFYHFLLDNECYATTGGQPVPNAKNVKYDLFAQAAGYAHTFAFDNLETFATNVERILAQPGPVFVWLKTVPEIQNVPMGQRKRFATRPSDQVREELQQALSIAGGR